LKSGLHECPTSAGAATLFFGEVVKLPWRTVDAETPLAGCRDMRHRQDITNVGDSAVINPRKS